MTPPTRRAPGRAGAPAEGRELRARGQRTVRKLLDAGVDVFGKRGYHSARVDDIVRTARTSHGTFYLYFSSKEDLFRALATDVGDELAALADDLGDLTPTPAGYAHLHEWLTRFAEVYRHYGPLIRAWTEAEIDANEVGRLGTDVLGRFAATLAERLAVIEGLPTHPQVTALALVAMIERLSFFGLSGPVRGPDERLVQTLTDVVYATLFGPEAPKR
jgi:AcrR family transcriptional regulator